MLIYSILRLIYSYNMRRTVFMQYKKQNTILYFNLFNDKLTALCRDKCAINLNLIKYMIVMTPATCNLNITLLICIRCSFIIITLHMT